MELGPKEKFFALNGVVCLAQALEGHFTTVDLRNETSVYGKVSQVDAYMNINMIDAVFINGLGEKHRFENFYIKDRNVRYIHIPDQVPIIGAIEKQLAKLVNPGRGRGMGKSTTDSTFKARRAIRKQKDTLALIDQARQKKRDQQEEEN